MYIFRIVGVGMGMEIGMDPSCRIMDEKGRGEGEERPLHI